MIESRDWEIKIGVFKGLLFGARKYEFDTSSWYSFYFLFFVFTLEIENPHVLF